MGDGSVKRVRVAIGSLGTVGMAVARRLDRGIGGLELTAVTARRLERAVERLQGFRHPPEVMDARSLADSADVVVECAPAEVFAEIAEPVLRAGKTLVPISAAALLSNWHLVELAERSGAQIIVPSGALLGLDAVRGAAEGHIDLVRMITRKPPGGLVGAPYLVAHGINLEELEKPLRVFQGTAREGAEGFPANVNVAASLALAGVGPDRTELEIWADPLVTRNTHTIVVEADSVRFEMTIENLPTEENARTGRLVALSVVATLRRLVSPLVIGT